jgi:hypothetical protein
MSRSITCSGDMPRSVETIAAIDGAPPGAGAAGITASGATGGAANTVGTAAGAVAAGAAGIDAAGAAVAGCAVGVAGSAAALSAAVDVGGGAAAPGIAVGATGVGAISLGAVVSITGSRAVGPLRGVLDALDASGVLDASGAIDAVADTAVDSLSRAAKIVRHARAPAERRSGVASGATAARIESSMDSMDDLLQDTSSARSSSSPMGLVGWVLSARTEEAGRRAGRRPGR